MESGSVRVVIAYDDVNLRVTEVSYVNDSDFDYRFELAVPDGHPRAGRTRAVDLLAHTARAVAVPTGAAQRLSVLGIVNGRPNIEKRLYRVGG